ncbi:MAG: hypothetical protein H7X88_00930 [Gloeobacteraceae cyanobacterium ES-bin-316]|nr:hypothetical protein [Ferruginibacter sp.]
MKIRVDGKFADTNITQQKFASALLPGCKITRRTPIIVTNQKIIFVYVNKKVLVF